MIRARGLRKSGSKSQPSTSRRLFSEEKSVAAHRPNSGSLTAVAIAQSTSLGSSGRAARRSAERLLELRPGRERSEQLGVLCFKPEHEELDRLESDP